MKRVLLARGWMPAHQCAYSTVAADFSPSPETRRAALVEHHASVGGLVKLGASVYPYRPAAVILQLGRRLGGFVTRRKVGGRAGRLQPLNGQWPASDRGLHGAAVCWLNPLYPPRCASRRNRLNQSALSLPIGVACSAAYCHIEVSGTVRT
jgi:hypothetical protein